MNVYAGSLAGVMVQTSMGTVKRRRLEPQNPALIVTSVDKTLAGRSRVSHSFRGVKANLFADFNAK